MSNLLKSGRTVNRDERIIDYNDIIKEKIDVFISEHAGKDEFVTGINAQVLEELPEDENAEVNSETAAGQTAVSMEDIQLQAEEIISQARQEAESIVNDANVEAADIRNEAETNGYNDGVAKAEQQLKDEISRMEGECNKKKELLEAEYADLKKKLEPQLVDVITDIFEKVTKAVSKDDKNVLLHLISSTMSDTEKSDYYTVCVSVQDYPFVSENRGKISCGINSTAQIDIQEDPKLKENECRIETDIGVFECGLDTELKSLIRNIKILSCT